MRLVDFGGAEETCWRCLGTGKIPANSNQIKETGKTTQLATSNQLQPNEIDYFCFRNPNDLDIVAESQYDLGVTDHITTKLDIGKDAWLPPTSVSDPLGLFKIAYNQLLKSEYRKYLVVNTRI
jgi:hypothetical protein